MIFLNILFIYYILKKMTLCSNVNNSHDVLEITMFNSNKSCVENYHPYYPVILYLIEY
jgi:hypothetical protein